MKDLITTIASILVLMVFLLQFTANQRIFTEAAGVENAIKVFRITAESKGKITDEDVSSMHRAAAKATGCDPSEIDMLLDSGLDSDLNSNKTEEPGYAAYHVRVPIRGIIGASHMLGISREENTLWYASSGIIVLPQEKENPPEKPKEEIPERLER